MLEQINYDEAGQITKTTVKQTAQKYMTTILEVIVLLIISAIIFSYFYTFNVDPNITFKDYTINALLVCFGTFSVGMLCRQIAINKARATEEYKKARQETVDEIKALRDKKYGQYVSKYCVWYSEELQKTEQTHILESVGLTYEDYKQKYAYKKQDKTFEELNELQNKSIKQADKVPLRNYDSNYLLTVDYTNSASLTPSNAYHPKKQMTKNTIIAILTTILGSLFVCSIGLDIILNFSTKTLVLAILKLIMLGVSSAFRLVFGWRFVFETEIPNLELKKSEIKNCIVFCETNNLGSEK